MAGVGRDISDPALVEPRLDLTPFEHHPTAQPHVRIGSIKAATAQSKGVQGGEEGRAEGWGSAFASEPPALLRTLSLPPSRSRSAPRSSYFPLRNALRRVA